MPKAKVVKIDTASIICQSPNSIIPIGDPDDDDRPEVDEYGNPIVNSKGQYIFDIFE